jgi:hypothetical protein
MNRFAAAAALAAAFFFLSTAGAANAFQMRMTRQPPNISPKLRQELSDRVSDEMQEYFAQEERKKEDKQPYVDLQTRFEYLPNWGRHGQVVVSVKLGGVEYDPTKSGSSMGGATGRLKYLVFTYRLEHGKWVEIAKPRWESQYLGRHAASELTAHTHRADEIKAAQEAAAKRRAEALEAQKKKAALNQALENRFGSGEGPVAYGPGSSPSKPSAQPQPQSK